MTSWADMACRLMDPFHRVFWDKRHKRPLQQFRSRSPHPPLRLLRQILPTRNRYFEAEAGVSVRPPANGRRNPARLLRHFLSHSRQPTSLNSSQQPMPPQRHGKLLVLRSRCRSIRSPTSTTPSFALAPTTPFFSDKSWGALRISSRSGTRAKGTIQVSTSRSTPTVKPTLSFRKRAQKATKPRATLLSLIHI